MGNWVLTVAITNKLIITTLTLKSLSSKPSESQVQPQMNTTFKT